MKPFRLRHAILAGLCCLPVFEIRGQVAAGSAAYENRLYLDAPWSGAVTFFGGHVTAAGNSNAPRSGDLILVHSAFGMPVAATLPRGDGTFCGENSGYDLWVQRFFAPGDYTDPNKALSQWGVHADPDGDGMENLLEYATGSEPGRVDNLDGVRWSIMDIAGTNYLFVTFRQRLSDPIVTLEIGISSNLVSWAAPPYGLVYVGATALDGEVQNITYRESLPFDPQTPRFLKRMARAVNESPPAVQLVPDTLLSAAGSYYGIVSNNMALAAPVGDGEGCVILMEYFVNGVRIGYGDANQPFSWRPTQPGTYEITARAIDNHGLAATATTRVTVDFDADGDGIPNIVDRRPYTPNAPPTITALGTSSAANFHDASSVLFSTLAGDPDGDPIWLALADGGVTVRQFQPLGPVLWQPPAGATGLHQFALLAKDEWNAPSQRAMDIYVFRTPPRP